MPRRGWKKNPDENAQEPKFNIDFRYGKLNSDQKNIMMHEASKTLGIQTRAFYKLLKRNILTDEELQFFAGMFGCGIPDLYSKKPLLRPTIYDLERRADKAPSGVQGGLDV